MQNLSRCSSVVKTARDVTVSTWFLILILIIGKSDLRILKEEGESLASQDIYKCW